MSSNDEIIEEFRSNEGHVGGPYEQMPLVLLHHRGAKSGREYVNPVAYQRVDDKSVAVFASAGGRPAHPNWFRNVVANPDVTVELGKDEFPARARVAEGKERERIWTAQVRALPQFGKYEETSGREIPVVVLEQVDR